MMTGQQLGSPDALSILRSPELGLAMLGAGIVIGGVALLVEGASFSYRLYEQYEEKKHLEEIKVINALHTKYLFKIIVPTTGEAIALPPIFKIKSDKEGLASVDAIHLNEDIIRSIGSKLPSGTDIALSRYQEAIYNAILKLKEYYFTISDKNSINASVICYLLEMLDSHCLKFAGYDYDIAYIDALSKFITAYASLEKHDYTSKFMHLDQVYRYLNKAHQLLDMHKDILSLQEILSELNHNSGELSNQLIRLFAMMTNPTKTWGYLDTVTREELEQGMIKRYFIYNDYFWGNLVTSDREIPILKSPFKSVLIDLTKFSLKSIDPNSMLTQSDIPIIKKEEFFPSLRRLSELRELRKKRRLTKQEILESKIIKDKLQEFKDAFSECNNFFTTVLDTKVKNAKQPFVPVRDNKLLEKRVGVIIDFADFIREIISLKYYSMELIKSIRLLGEIDITNLEHKKIFNTLNELCNKIKSYYIKLKEEIRIIENQSDNAMRMENETEIKRLSSVLEVANKTVENAKSAINKYWNKNKNISAERKQLAENNLFIITEIFSDTLELKTHEHKKHKSHNKHINHKVNVENKSTLFADKNKGLEKADVNFEDGKNAAKITGDDKHLARHDKSDLEILAIQKSESTKPDPTQSPPAKPASPAIAPIINSSLTMNLINKYSTYENEIDKNLKDILQSIYVIKKSERPSSKNKEGVDKFNDEILVYNKLYQCLIHLYQKIKLINGERCKTDMRERKAFKLYVLLVKLSSEVGAYLSLDRDERVKKVSELCNKIKIELSNPDTAFYIDDHRDAWKKCFSIQTDSRAKVVEIQLACEEIMNLLVERGNVKTLA